MIIFLCETKYIKQVSSWTESCTKSRIYLYCVGFRFKGQCHNLNIMANKLVFFVDDDKMILNLLEYTFKSRQGIDVKTFFSGEECLQNMHLKPDLIVLDHLFPKNKGQMSGMETLKKLKEADKKVTVIVLSAQQDEKLIPEFLKNGAKKYISKDEYFIDELIESIESGV